MSPREALELAGLAVTVVGLPFAVWVYLAQQSKERENEEEEGYQHLSDAYNDFLGVVLANADLRLRTTDALPAPTPEQHERMLTIFDMLVSLFERAFIVAHKTDMSPTEQRRWNSWDDYMREWCRRQDFANALPFLLMVLPGRTVKRTTIATLLVMFGVFMMRWNVVIGGQAFSLSFAGFMHYHLPLLPTSWETFREGLFGALTVMTTPFVIFWFLNKIFPAFLKEEEVH